MTKLLPEEIKEIEATFHKHGFQLKYFSTSQEALTYLLDQIKGRTIGFGDSQTLWQMQLYQHLKRHNDVVDPMHREETESFKAAGQRCLNRDIFISSANALTVDGYLVNMDGTGNRVAGTLFSANEVYFICGTNKLCPNLEAALERVRNVAAPQNTRRKNLKTPCAKLEPHCYNCDSIDRICNALVIYYHKMRNVDAMHIILIDEQLGY